jgi:hypothetical protein
MTESVEHDQLKRLEEDFLREAETLLTRLREAYVGETGGLSNCQYRDREEDFKGAVGDYESCFETILAEAPSSSEAKFSSERWYQELQGLKKLREELEERRSVSKSSADQVGDNSLN